MLLFAASDKPAAALLNPFFCPATTSDPSPVAIVDAPTQTAAETMAMSEPSGPGRQGESVFILGLFLLSSQLLILPSQPFCGNMEALEYFPDEGFAQQIDVTVGVALVIEWAARKKAKNTAVRVLQQLISGEVGSAKDWEKTRARMNKVTPNIRKEIGKKSESWFSAESVQARLSSPFRLSQGVHYPRILTLKQQEKSAPNTLPGELQHPLLPALHAGRAHHEDNSNAVVHLLRVRLQHPAPRRRQHRRRRQRRRGRRSRPCRQWTPMAKL